RRVENDNDVDADVVEHSPHVVERHIDAVRAESGDNIDGWIIIFIAAFVEKIASATDAVEIEDGDPVLAVFNLIVQSKQDFVESAGEVAIKIGHLKHVVVLDLAEVKVDRAADNRRGGGAGIGDKFGDDTLLAGGNAVEQGHGGCLVL